MPVAMAVGIARSQRKTGVDSLGDVVLRAHTSIDGLNGPLQLRQQLLTSGGVDGDALEAVHTDQREADALDVNVVDFRINKDVVNVQLNRAYGLSSRHCAVGHNDGLTSHETAVASDGSTSSQTVSVGETLNSQLEEQVASSGEHDLVLSLELNGDESLTIRDGHARNAQAGVLVEPKQQRNPEIQNGLGSLGSLGTVDNLAEFAASVSGVRGGHGSSKARAGDGEAVSLSGEGRSSGHGAQVGVCLNGHLLADQALPAGKLAGGNLEFLVEKHGLSGVLIKRVTVDLKLHVLEQTLAGVFGIANKVLSGVSSAVDNVTVKLHVVVRVASVVASRGSGGGTRDGAGSTERLIGSADVAGEGGDRAGSCGSAGHGVEHGVNHHVVEKVTELGDAELNRATELGLARASADLVVFVANSRYYRVSCEFTIDTSDLWDSSSLLSDPAFAVV